MGILYYLFLSYSLSTFFIFLFLSQIMSILNLIEAKIGSVQYWPQDILRYLFYIRRPTYFMIAEIVELLFGNKISREDALELFDVCSNFWLKCEELLNKNYEVWSINERQTQMATYYNMGMGRMVHINGSDCNQLELVDVDLNEIKIGFGDFFQTLLGIEF